MGAANITRLQDAASIVGDDLAKRLEELTQEGLADDEEGFETQALVVKAEAETETEPVVVKSTKAQAQIQRSRRWGILIRQDGHVTIPLNERGAGATFMDYGDPVNCLFPIWLTKNKGSLTPTMLQHVEGALVQYGLHRDKYDVESQSKIGSRIAQARSKFGVEKGTEERSYYVPEPVWTSWGGATTIAAAVDFIEAQDAAHELLSEVDLLEGVFRNILNVPGVEDKATALKNVTEEFAARIGSKPESEGDQTMTVRSEQSTVATEPAVQTIPMVPAAAPAAPTPASAPAVAPVVTQAAVVAPASAVAPAPAAVTPDVVSAASTAVQPAVQAITKFQAGVVGVLNQAELSTEDRLKAIQPLLETMAGAVAESAQSPPDAGTQLVAAFSKAMAAELRPLVEQIQMTLTQLGQGVPQGPARKTYSHVGLVRATPVAEEGKPPSIREIARGSTGLSS